MILPGSRPIIRLPSTQTATICPVLVFSATTDGSLSTMPRPLTYTRVFAVPRSTAMSRPRNAIALLLWNKTLPAGSCQVIWSFLLRDDAPPLPVHAAAEPRPTATARQNNPDCPGGRTPEP